MQRVLICSAIALMWAANAAADSPNLKGAYAFTGTEACLVAPHNFNANLTPVDDQIYSESASVEGVRTFNGDGTGTVRATTVSVIVPPTPGSPIAGAHGGSSSVSYSFSYTVEPDGTFTTDVVTGSFMGTQLTGPDAGATFTINNFPQLTGMIGDNAKTLTLATLVPTVETVVFAPPHYSPYPRICHRSRVLIAIGERQRW